MLAQHRPALTPATLSLSLFLPASGSGPLNNHLLFRIIELLQQHLPSGSSRSRRDPREPPTNTLILVEHQLITGLSRHIAEQLGEGLDFISGAAVLSCSGPSINSDFFDSRQPFYAATRTSDGHLFLDSSQTSLNSPFLQILDTSGGRLSALYSGSHTSLANFLGRPVLYISVNHIIGDTIARATTHSPNTLRASLPTAEAVDPNPTQPSEPLTSGLSSDEEEDSPEIDFLLSSIRRYVDCLQKEATP